MHTQYPKIEDDIEFPKVLTVKQMPEKSESWISRGIEITATISSRLKPRQGVLQGVLQTLRYNIVDMHNITPRILEDMAFQR
jgi:hypothetical protein